MTTFAIVSDLHVAHALTSDTFNRYDETPLNNRHPLNDLSAFIQKGGLRADYLICGGDLANKAEPAGLTEGWARFHHLATSLGAKPLAVPGNHDFSTRQSLEDASTPLLALRPTYPTGNPALDAEFWADGLTIVEDAEVRIVLLNSCVLHTAEPPAAASHLEKQRHKNEIERGAVTEEMLVLLESRLSSIGPIPKANLLLCHHHPVEHETLAAFQDDYGSMTNGRRLMELLQGTSLGRWFVVHGHKHIPRIVNAAGDSNSPIVMGCASLGAHLWPQAASVTKHQFHYVEMSASGLGLRGTVRSWVWSFGHGWAIAESRQSGLPSYCGFGATVDPTSLVALLNSCLARGDHMSWADLLNLEPSLAHLLPSELERMESHLDSNGYELLSRRGSRVQIRRI